MKHDEKIQMLQTVFAPRSGEKVLILVDTPHDKIKDTPDWRERRKMAQEWYMALKEMGVNTGFTVTIRKFQATGLHNSPIPREIRNAASQSNLVIAMTEYSASAPLLFICTAKNAITRAGSMPGVQKSMEKTAFQANYREVKRYASAITKMLTDAVGAEIVFSTNDTLYIDLRNRVADADSWECTHPGQFINFPSGESCIAPYEAAPNERKKYGVSKTQGIWPVSIEGELMKFVVRENRITDIIGSGKKTTEMRRFFNENDTRRNVAELGIGCNPNAVITGNILEDEKVGLHIAYGQSTHLGGRVTSDMHEDVCYSKGCPVEGTTVVLMNQDGSKTEIIRGALLRYDLLR
jgi:leucyl aminopeptidase (aminopeptidase T)